MVFWLLFSNESIQNILILSATVAPFASAGIRPVVNRLNQETTVYYGLVFCAFSWPYMVKWHNSGIISSIIYTLYIFWQVLQLELWYISWHGSFKCCPILTCDCKVFPTLYAKVCCSGENALSWNNKKSSQLSLSRTIVLLVPSSPDTSNFNDVI